MKFIYMVMISMSMIFVANANALDYADDEYIEEMNDMFNIGIDATNEYIDYRNDNYIGTNWRCSELDRFLDVYNELDKKYDYAIEKYEAFLDYYQDTSYKAEKRLIRKAKEEIEYLEERQGKVYKFKQKIIKGCGRNY